MRIRQTVSSSNNFGPTTLNDIKEGFWDIYLLKINYPFIFSKDRYINAYFKFLLLNEIAGLYFAHYFT